MGGRSRSGAGSSDRVRALERAAEAEARAFKALAIAALTNAGGCWLRRLRLRRRVHSPPVEAAAALATFRRQQTARRGRLWAALDAERAAPTPLSGGLLAGQSHCG